MSRATRVAETLRRGWGAIIGGWFPASLFGIRSGLARLKAGRLSNKIDFQLLILAS